VVEHTLDGNLAHVNIIALLQGLCLAKMNGRLELADLDLHAQVFFINGLVVHALTKDLVGDDALLEIAMWEAGQFKFYPNQSITKVTIRSRLDTLMIKAGGICDKQCYLHAIGLKQQSILLRREAKRSEPEVAELLLPVKLDDQRPTIEFYLLIDDGTTLGSIVEKSKLAKIKYIPILHNLFKCKLVEIGPL